MIKKYIYLTSSAYSGSTLIAAIMGSHSEISTVGELSAIENVTRNNDYICSCGKKLLDCSFWKTLESLTFESKVDESLKKVKTKHEIEVKSFLDKVAMADRRFGPLLSLKNQLIDVIPKYKTHYKKITTSNLDMACAILKIENKTIFFDASKKPSYIRHYFKALNDDLRVVHLVKDGRGVLSSSKKYHPKVDESTLINRWKQTNLNAERELRNLPTDLVHFISYKDLANNPVEELTKLCDFAGIDFEPEMLHFRQQTHHILGNTSMRLGSDKEIYYDESWREKLSSESLEKFEVIAGELNRKYGFL